MDHVVAGTQEAGALHSSGVLVLSQLATVNDRTQATWPCAACARPPACLGSLQRKARMAVVLWRKALPRQLSKACHVAVLRLYHHSVARTEVRVLAGPERLERGPEVMACRSEATREHRVVIDGPEGVGGGSCDIDLQRAPLAACTSRVSVCCSLSLVSSPLPVGAPSSFSPSQLYCCPLKNTSQQCISNRSSCSLVHLPQGAGAGARASHQSAHPCARILSGRCKCAVVCRASAVTASNGLTSGAQLLLFVTLLLLFLIRRLPLKQNICSVPLRV